MSAYTRSRVNTFAALPLERAADQRDNPEWIAERSLHAAARFLLVRPDGQSLLQSDQAALLQLTAEQRQRLLPNIAFSYLGAHAEIEHFLLALDTADAEPRCVCPLSMRACSLTRGHWRTGSHVPCFAAVVVRQHN
jgi:NAD+ diphosphatase